MDPNSVYTGERTFGGGTAASFSGSFTPPHSYALSGKIMLSAIIILFSVVLAIFILHVYIRWHLHRLTLQRRRRPGRPLIFSSEIRGTAAAPRGLDPKTLNSLPVLVYDGDKSSDAVECSVCLCEFEKGETVRCLPQCGHHFHIDCIAMWFHSHSTCPICRSGVQPVVKVLVTDLTLAVSGCGTGPENGIGSSSTVVHVSRVLELPQMISDESKSPSGPELPQMSRDESKSPSKSPSGPELPQMSRDESKSPSGPMGAIRKLLRRDFSLQEGAAEEAVVDLERGENTRAAVTLRMLNALITLLFRLMLVIYFIRMLSEVSEQVA